MLSSFVAWWISRIAELVPRSWTDTVIGVPDSVVIEATDDNLVASIRRKGRREIVSLGVAARMSGRKPVLLRPPAEFVLVKHHIVPTAAKRELSQLLRYELARITPFPPEELFWRWDGHLKPGDKTRTEITLTMVPKAVLAAALTTLATSGLQPNFVEVGPIEKPLLLPISDHQERSGREVLVRGFAWGCAGLAIIVLSLPLVLQTYALHTTNDAIADLQPSIKQVEALRHGIAAGDAGREALAKEEKRTGDLLQVLATVTRILPDDTFLTDFSLRDRQMTISGRSASAPRLITSLSADPAVSNTAFAAPVTRIQGATSDVFSIKAELAP